MKEIFPHLKVIQIGSSVTCSPPPENGDIDYLIYVANSQLNNVEITLRSLGFVLEGDEFYDFAIFRSWRKGNINCIVAEDLKWVQRFVAASFIAKKLNLQQKKHRVSICRFIIDGLADESFLEVYEMIENEL